MFRRLAQEAESWLKNEEEERKKAVEEAARKEEDERKKKEDEEIKKKQKGSEGLILARAKKDQQTTEQIDTQEAQEHTDQGHGQDNPDPQESAATFGSTQEQVVFSGLNLIPFMQKEGEEVPDFSTIFYDRKKKRIVKRTKKKSKQEDNQV